MTHSSIEYSLPDNIKSKINYSLYFTSITVCIVSMYIPSRIMVEPIILNSIIKYSIILFLISIMGFSTIKYLTIPIMSQYLKVSHENIESYLFNNLTFERRSKVNTNLFISIPFKFYQLQIPVQNILLTFLLCGFTIELFHHAFDISKPITNVHYFTNGNLASGRLADQAEEYLEDEKGNSGYKEWYGYRFKVEGKQFMCWIPWHEEEIIEIQYLDFNPNENRLYVDRSKAKTVLYLIGSFAFTVIVILFTVSAESGQGMWQNNINVIPTSKIDYWK